MYGAGLVAGPAASVGGCGWGGGGTGEAINVFSPPILGSSRLQAKCLRCCDASVEEQPSAEVR
jgi:hypothetical protein